jgi:acyl-CoA thioesterase I
MKTNLTVVAILFLFAGTAFAAQQIKISCIGNSITAASGTLDYTIKLNKLLGTTAYKIENEGVSGTTLLKNGDHPYWKEGKFSKVFAFQPNIVTIKLGTNDTKPQNWDSHYNEFKTDYLAMIDTLNSLASKPKVWIVLPIAIFSNSYGIRDSALDKINIILKQIAQERNLPVIDANTPFKNNQKYYSDGVHPNAEGADTIAHVFYRALTSSTAIIQGKQRPRHAELPDGMSTNSPVTVITSGGTPAILGLFDLCGRTIRSRTLCTPGRHALGETGALHGVYIVRLEGEAISTLNRTIQMP